MLINRLSRNIREGFKNLFRNKIFTFASIITMSLCIFLIGIFFAIGLNIMTILKDVESRVPITVFFQKNISLVEQKNIKNKIDEDARVKKTRYISAKEAWENYKKIYFKNKPDLAEGFKDDNPLADASSIEIYLKNIKDQNELSKELKRMDGIRQVNQASTAAEKLQSFNKVFSYISLAVIALLIFISVFLISNTVLLGISVRREEIHIMQYVGAKDKFIRGPFVTEGVIIGIIGVIIPLVIEYVLYSKIFDYFNEHFDILDSYNTLLPVNKVFMYFAPIAIVVGILLSYLDSRITVSRHLCK